MKLFPMKHIQASGKRTVCLNLYIMPKQRLYI